MSYDIAIIGGGVVGCAVARELAGFDLRIVLIEARGDVGDATSKANTAILHTGFDAVPGSLESTMVARGYALLAEYAQVTGIPVEPTGALLVAWDPEQLTTLPKLRDKAEKNGYAKCAIVDADEIYRRVPHLGPGALGGLTVPDESIICPWTTPLAYATEAKARGVDIRLNTFVESIEVGHEATVLRTTSGDITTRWLINAAGLGGDVIDRMLGFDRFTIVPRRGELFVFDKLTRPMASTIVLPVPTEKGKGVLISPTIYGNVMLGPTSENLIDRTDTSTSEEGFAFLLEKGAALMPTLLTEEVTASYAGLRASTEHSDYVVDLDVSQRYLLLGGIRSTGLTASMALGEYSRDLLGKAGVILTKRTELPDPPRMPNIGEAFPRPYQRDDLIESNPEYGEIVCFCERVTRGEIRDALASPLPPCDLDGLRRRTRALMGRCQGFFCGAEIDELMRSGGTDHE
jgi:glycerol-3-phosphate dehydrogenase